MRPQLRRILLGSAAVLSPALTLLGTENEGMASDFTVAGGSVAVRDLTTLANNVDTDATWWTNVGTSPKLVRQADGTLRWSRHNFAMNTRWAGGATPPTNYTQPSATGTATAVPSLFHAGHTAFRFQGTAQRPYFQTQTAAVPVGLIEISATFEAGTPVDWFSMLAYTGTGTTQGFYVNGVLNTTSGAVIPTLTPGDRISLLVAITVAGTARFGLGGSGNSTGDFTLSAPMVAQWRPGGNAYLENTSTTAALIHPAQDYHDTKGWALLVEPSATNLVIQSYNFGEAGWSTSGTTKTTGQLAPDGTNTAMLIKNNAGGPAVHLVLRANFFTTVAAQVYTASVYVKQGTAPWFYFGVGVGGGTAHRVYARFEFATEAFTVFDSASTWVKGTTAIVERVGNGWYRLAFSLTNSVAENAGISFGPIAGVSSLTWTADGTETVYVWAPQIETGAIPTSFIPTGAATVTRAGDRVERASSAVPAGTGYTLFVDADFPAVINTATSGTLIGVANATSTEVFTLYTNNAAARQHNRTGGVTNVDFSAGNGHVANGRVQLTGAFATDDYAGSMNGAAVVTDTAGTLASSTTVIGLGQFGAGSLPVVEPTRIRRVMMVPRRVSNADLPTWRYAA